MKEETKLKISRTMKLRGIKPVFNLGMLGKNHSKITIKKISVNTKLAMQSKDIIKKISGSNGSSWKGKSAKYQALHSWLRKKNGKAYKCENKNCNKKSKTFEWANVSGEYSRYKKDYAQLCRSCHVKLDRNWEKRIYG